MDKGGAHVRTRSRAIVFRLRASFPRPLLALVAILLTTVVAVPSTAGASASPITYTATETIPVPPQSAFAGSGDGDGWGLGLTNTQVFNVFHHQSSLQVSCHNQSDASDCWAGAKTITDSSGNNFASSSQPGLWVDQVSGHLFVFATRTSDSTAGVVCIDTSQPASTADPFCGFTALSAIGSAPLISGISGISDPVVVGTRWYAFNVVDGVPTATEDQLLCFNLTTLSGCASQPFSVNFGSGSVSDLGFPSPSIAVIESQIIIPIALNGTTDELACFDAATQQPCAGAWPVSTTGLGYPEASNSGGGGGAPFPLLNSEGVPVGLCLPITNDPCFSLAGNTVATPSSLAATVLPNAGWDGQSITIGPRVYVPGGNFSGTDQVNCFDYSTGASCVNFPKTFSNLFLLYSVNSDFQRPTCIWVNADSGADQIQNFDAYTGGACGQGPIRVLASAIVVPTQLCIPFGYTSLKVLSPAPGLYTSGSVSFEDSDGSPIPGVADRSLDNTGTVNLTGLNLNTDLGLPQFLITLVGAQGTPNSVEVRLTWTGVRDPSCIPGGAPPRYVALGDSVPYGHGLANPTTSTQRTTSEGDLSPNQGPSDQAYPSLVATDLGYTMNLRATGCTLTGDNLAVSGAPSSTKNADDNDNDCPNKCRIPFLSDCFKWCKSANWLCYSTLPHKAIDDKELSAANLSKDPPALVTIQVGADDIDFTNCIYNLLGVPFPPSHSCTKNGPHGELQVATEEQQDLNTLSSSLGSIVDTIKAEAPNAKILLLGYYQIAPSPDETLVNDGHSVICNAPFNYGLINQNKKNRLKIYTQATFLQGQLNGVIQRVAATHGVQYVDLTHLFDGKEMCTADSEVFTDPTWRDAHPTAAGQMDIASAVEAALGP